MTIHTTTYTAFQETKSSRRLAPDEATFPREKMNNTSARGEKEGKSAESYKAIQFHRNSQFVVYLYRTADERHLRPDVCPANMKAGPILQLILLVMLLAGPSEEFFLEYSKKALQNFFQSLKAKKQPNIQHYHVHYYPMPYSMLTWPKVPAKRDIEKLYDDPFAFGWPDYQYKYLPHPSMIMSDLQQLLDAEIPTLDDTPATIDRNGQGLLLQVPLNQQLVLHLLRRAQQQQLAKAAT